MLNAIFKESVCIIEHDPIHLQILKDKLQRLNITNVVGCESVESFEHFLSGEMPSLVISEFYLNNAKTANDVCKLLLRYDHIPLIVISSFFNNDTLDKLNSPIIYDFLPKSCSDFELLKSITLSRRNFDQEQKTKKLKDAIFVKSGKLLRKVDLREIEYILVDGKYLDIYTMDQQKYTIRSTLNNFIDKLPDNFIKISQSTIVNIWYIEHINIESSEVKTKFGKLTFSRSFKKTLLNSYYLP